MNMPWPKWHKNDGEIVSCFEKVKVMEENLDEIRQMAQDAFEDGLLMEVSEAQMREALHRMVDTLINPYGR
ncbi:hypothetical protein [Chitinimonas sp. BJB300]|uniref:hypothetical protein n=1 Tax=Chitinimonas sp. BJB300 TaxID=1559339 RepID=UPI000C0CA06B|nr:hypothetical protein [Chitinimonas sp. BJB300]PHV12013.1 hypothetical protein CSQ89_08095 [Chitinimonas sp. BJB300]TSJ91456.1 hypothetical protein FG002_004040 [Chitinimonas sp. BJB300]